MALTPEKLLEVVKQTKKGFRYTDDEQPVKNYERSVEELNLSHMKIGKIANLTPFVSLRKLTLLDNDLTEICGLESCRVLEELSLEKNYITHISNL